MRSALVIPALVLVLVLAPARADVRTVAPSGADFTTIQAAIDASQDGDVLLVKSGSYAGFTLDGKSLTIAEDATHTATVTGRVTIRNVGTGQMVRLLGVGVSSPNGTPLLVQDCAGTVRVEALATASTAPAFSAPGLDVRTCSDVALTACSFRGAWGGQGGSGSPGVTLQASQVAFDECTIEGGRGGTLYSGGSTYPLPGGHGASISGSVASFARCTIRGGEGAPGGITNIGESGCLCCWVTPGAAGGAGIHVESSSGTSHLDLAGTTAIGGQGGAGGVHPMPSCGYPPAADGPDGAANDAPAAWITSYDGGGRALRPILPVRELATASVTVDGTPGERAVLFLSTTPAHASLPVYQGSALISTTSLRRIGLGTIGAGGTLTVALPIGALPAALASKAWGVQALCFDDAAGTARITGASTLLVLDAAY